MLNYHIKTGSKLDIRFQKKYYNNIYEILKINATFFIFPVSNITREANQVMTAVFARGGKYKCYENAIEVLFEDNYDRVYRKAASILVDRELTKDAVQETFYRAFLKLDTLQDKSKFSPWVCAIAVNVCNRMLREKITYRSNNISIYDDEGNMRKDINELIDFEVPDKIYDDTETRHELKDCIDELDVESQQIINMRFYNDFSIMEIAECMSMKEGTVKSKIYRAKQKVADKLRKLVDMRGE